MGKSDIIAKLRTITTNLYTMIAANIGQKIAPDGSIWTEGEVHEDNIMPIDSVADIVHIAEDLASYYYLLKRIGKVSNADIKAEYELQLYGDEENDGLLDEIWVTYGLNEAAIEQAREFIAEFTVVRESIENFLESLF